MADDDTSTDDVDTSDDDDTSVDDDATDADDSAGDDDNDTKAPPRKSGDKRKPSDPVADELAKERKARKAAEADAAKLRKDQLSDADRALEEAKDAGRDEAKATFSERIAAAEIKAALAGKVSDPAAVVEDLNLSKFVDDDGDVDADKVAALVKKYERIAPKGAKGGDPLKQGYRGGNAPSLEQQIAEAKAKGDTRTAIRLELSRLAPGN